MIWGIPVQSGVYANFNVGINDLQSDAVSRDERKVVRVSTRRVASVAGRSRVHAWF